MEFRTMFGDKVPLPSAILIACGYSAFLLYQSLHGEREFMQDVLFNALMCIVATVAAWFTYRCNGKVTPATCVLLVPAILHLRIVGQALLGLP